MSFPFVPNSEFSDYYFGLPVLGSRPTPGGDTVQKLGALLQQNQAQGDQQRMAEMAAARLEGYGGPGTEWAAQIRKDPRAALMLADQYGGFAEIEKALATAHAQGRETQAISEMQQSGAKPEDIVGYYLRTQGPEAASQAAKALGVGPQKAPQRTTRHLPNGYKQDMEWDGKQWNPAGDPYPPSGGIQIGQDENGNMIVSVGGQGLTNTSRSKIEQGQINAQATLDRLDQIQASFDPSFQTFGTKAKMEVLKATAFLGGDLKPEDQGMLERYTTARVAAYNNMSQVLHELSGAAISPAEEKRLLQMLPNPGTGPFDGDDWVTFKAKLDAVTAETRRALQTYQGMAGRGAASAPAPIPNNPAAQASPAPIGPTPARPPMPDPMVNGKRVDWQWDPQQGDWYYED